MKKKLTYGVLTEVVQDWVKRRKKNNKILIQILENEKLIIQISVGGIHYPQKKDMVYLLTKRIEEEDLLDDNGVLLNGESPKDILRYINQIDDYDLVSNTPVGIEIWFDDPSEEGGEIQYNIESHHYLIEDQILIVQYELNKDEPDIHNNEFKTLLKSQYVAKVQ